MRALAQKPGTLTNVGMNKGSPPSHALAEAQGLSCSFVYRAALRRLAEAPIRFPAPRAHADRMQNRESSMPSRRSQQALEQHLRDFALPCAAPFRCLV